MVEIGSKKRANFDFVNETKENIIFGVIKASVRPNTVSIFG